MKRRALAFELPSKRTCESKSIPQGEILTDLKDKKWKLGPAIGIGGFGEIYLGKCSIRFCYLLITTDLVNGYISNIFFMFSIGRFIETCCPEI